MSDERLEAIKRRMGNRKIESFTQSEMKYLFDKIDRLQAANSALVDTMRAIANDQESNDFSDGDKWRGLKSAAQDALAAYERAGEAPG